MLMKPIDYLKTLIKSDTGNSSKSFGLVLSAIIGGLIGLCVCIVLLYDVFEDGRVETDLEDLGWFLMCSAVYMFGGGLNKTISETLGNKKSYTTAKKKTAGKKKTEEPEEEEWHTPGM